MLCSSDTRSQRLALAVVSSVALLTAAVAHAQDIEAALASKIILKVLLFDEDIEQKTQNHVVVGVIGSDAAYEAFLSLKGQKIDQGRDLVVSEVVLYEKIPGASERPTVLFVGSGANPQEILSFTRSNKVLSATNVASFVHQGVTVGVTVQNSRPRVLLNLVGSEEEGMNWNPKILKIARIIK